MVYVKRLDGVLVGACADWTAAARLADQVVACTGLLVDLDDRE